MSLGPARDAAAESMPLVITTSAMTIRLITPHQNALRRAGEGKAAIPATCLKFDASEDFLAEGA